MKKKIIIRLDRNYGELLFWSTFDNDVSVAGGQCSISELVPLTVGHSIVVVVPGEDVLLTSVHIPGRKKFNQAIPYALEDHLADDITNLHFVTLSESKNGNIAVAVVAQEKMNQWVDLFIKVGLRPDAIVPDTLTLPVHEKAISLAFDEGIALLRTGPHSGFVADIDNFAQLVLPELERLDSPDVYVYGEVPPEIHKTIIRDQDSAVINKDEPLLEIIMAGAAAQDSINLAEGSFAQESKYQSRWLTWRLPLVLVFFFLIVHLLNVSLELHSFEGRSQHLATQISTIFRGAFPESRRFTNARSQMAYKLELLQKASKKDDNLLVLLKKSAPVIYRVTQDSLQSIRYRNRNLVIELRLADLQGLEGLKNALSAETNIAVTVVSAVTTDDYLTAEVSLKVKK